MIEQILKRTIGLPCCRAYLGFYGILCISFGNKIYYEYAKIRNRFHGEFDFKLYFATK